MKMNENATLPQNTNNDFQKLLSIDLNKLDNPLLSKLVEEVRNEESAIKSHDYNRFHNRHNRS